MALSLDKSITIASKPEVVLEKLWIRQIVISTPSPLMEGSILLEYGPWSGDITKDAVWRNSDGEDITKKIELSTLYGAMLEVPELMIAFNAILDALKPVESYVALKEAASPVS